MISKQQFPLLLFSMLLLLGATVSAEPSDSYDIWALARPKANKFFMLELRKQDPLWLEPYATTSITGGWGQTHHQQIGGLSSFSTENRRSAYLYRYDYQYAEHHSINFKYIHEDLYFLSSGKESMGFAFNSFWGTQNSYGVYFSLGYYSRWLKQRWDSNQHLPLTFNTNDYESFFSLIWGARFPFLNKSALSIDFNNQDTFHYYTSDNWAIDTKLYIPASNNFMITLLAGTRFTGLTGVALNPSEYYATLGFIWN